MWITTENISSLLLHITVLTTVILVIFFNINTKVEHRIIDNHSEYMCKHVVEQIQFLPDELRNPIKTQISNLVVKEDTDIVTQNNKVQQKCMKRLAYLWTFAIITIALLWTTNNFDLYSLISQVFISALLVTIIELGFSYYFLAQYRIINPNNLNHTFYNTLRNHANKCKSALFNVKVIYWFGNPSGKRKEKIGTLYIDMSGDTSPIYINIGDTRWLLLVDMNFMEISRILGMKVITGASLPENLNNSLFINTTGNIPLFYQSKNQQWNRLYNTQPTIISQGQDQPTSSTPNNLYLDNSSKLLYVKDENIWIPTFQTVTTGTDQQPTGNTDVYINTETNNIYKNTGSDWMII